mgnify:CR=1 FL=1
MGRTSAVPAAVGAWIAAAIYFTPSASFANPAVTLAFWSIRRFPGREGAAGKRKLRVAVTPTFARSILMPRLRAQGVRAVSPSGVLGDPTSATAAAFLYALSPFVLTPLARLTTIGTCPTAS